MKALIVYDSLFGNNEKIAKAIGKAISCETKIVRAGEADFSALKEAGILVVGSPTHGGRPIESVKKFLKDIPEQALQGKTAAAYDTRLSLAPQNFVVREFLKILGHASPRIAKALQKKGARMITAPESFNVEDGKGPLEKGELERAIAWAGKLCKCDAIGQGN